MKKIILTFAPILVAVFFILPNSTQAISCSQCADETDQDACYASCTPDGGGGGGGGGGGFSIDSCVNSGSQIGSLLSCAGGIIQALIYLLISLAVIITIWGAVRFIGAEPGTDRQKWRDQMVYGIIAIAVILSIWALVAILRNTFGVSGGETLPPPSLDLTDN